jgi:protein ImuB
MWRRLRKSYRDTAQRQRDKETRRQGDKGTRRQENQGTERGIKSLADSPIPAPSRHRVPLSPCPRVPLSPCPLVSVPLPPSLLTRTIADRQLVMAVSEEAGERGIRRGMTLTQARALCAEVQHAPYEPEQDQRALEALARWMMRFSPVVCCGIRDAKEEIAPNAIFLDITGCERAFDGFENIVSHVSESLSRFGVHARIAAAPTPGAAWALAYAGKERTIIEEYQLESALAPLPVEALRVGDEIAAGLRHLGLDTVDQVMHLPREVLPARFGPVLLRRIDQAMGRIAEPLVPLEYRTAVQARMDFDATIQSLETIWSVFQKLIGQVIEQLVSRGQGARRVDVELLRAHDIPVKKTILLSRPSRDPANLFNLFRCALEELELPLRERPRSRLRGRRPGAPSPQAVRQSQRSAPGFVISKIDDEGFCGLRISVPLCERLTDEQISLLDHEQYAGQMELDRLIERLRIRLGNEAIVRAELVESHVPEEAWKEEGETRRQGDKATRRRDKKAAHQVAFPSPCLLVPVPPCLLSPRPLHLLPTPTVVRVMVTPSEDAEGRPAAFTHEGIVRRVLHSVGPERIAGRWWDGHDKTRDYFDIADATGRRFWIFRVRQTGKWYLHGIFE